MSLETEDQLAAQPPAATQPPPPATQPLSATKPDNEQTPLPQEPPVLPAPLPQPSNEAVAAAALKSPTSIAPPPLPMTSVALPPLPSDLQNLMSSIPQLVPGKPIRPVEVQTQAVSRSSGAPVTLEPLSSYLTK